MLIAQRPGSGMGVAVFLINGAAGQYASASGAGYANLSMEVDHAFGKKRRFSIHVFRASLSELRRR